MGPLGALVEPPPTDAPRFPRLTKAAAGAAPRRLVIVPPGPRYDQTLSSRGSCTANGSSKQIAVSAGIPIVVSVDAVYFWARRESGFAPSQDSGAYPEALARAYRKFGVPSVAKWRDTTSPTDDHWTRPPDAATVQQAKDHLVTEHYRVTTPEHRKAALLSGHLPGIAAVIRTSFRGVKADGLWRKPSGAEEGGHWMAVVGYDDDLVAAPGYPPGSEIVLQSWGEYGEAIPEAPQYGRSFFRLPYAAREEGFVYDGLVFSVLDRVAGG